MMKRLACALLLAAAVSACGGSSNSPSQKIPNYAGTWSGNYTITGCTQSGTIALANICGSLGTAAPYGFALVQSSRSVTGSFTLGTAVFPNTGATIADDGSLAIAGTTISNTVTVVVNWALNITSAQLGGTVTQVWSSSGLSGTANVVGTITSAAHTASVGVTPPPFLPSTLEEAIHGVIPTLR